MTNLCTGSLPTFTQAFDSNDIKDLIKKYPGSKRPIGGDRDGYLNEFYRHLSEQKTIFGASLTSGTKLAKNMLEVYNGPTRDPKLHVKNEAMKELFKRTDQTACLMRINTEVRTLVRRIQRLIQITTNSGKLRLNNCILFY